MCKAWCIINAQLMLGTIVVILMTTVTLRTCLVCPQDLKVEYHFTLPWISEKGADREDTKCSVFENGQRQEQ